MFLIFLGFSSAQFHSYLFETKGLKAIEVGLVLTMGYAAAILSPAAQVHLIRYMGGARRPLLIMLALSGICLVALPHLDTFWALASVFALGTFCLSSVHPLNVACTLENLRHLGHGLFFKLRTLGTVGFLIGCLGSVFFKDLSDLPWLYGGFALALGVAFLSIHRAYRNPEDTGIPMKAAPSLKKALRLLARPRTLRLLIIIGVVNLANSMATGVQGNYLINHWESGQQSISQAWIISTACEVPWMFLCIYILRKYHLRYVLLLGVLGTVVKLAGMGFSQSLWQFYLSLTLHGFFFAGAATGFNVYLDRCYGPSERPTLQTFSMVFCGSIPYALGALLAGIIWEWVSLPAVYWTAAIIALGAGVFGTRFLLDLKVPPVAGMEASPKSILEPTKGR